MSFPFVPLGVILLLLPIHHGPVARASPSLAMESPWWENYDQKDRYICSGRTRSCWSETRLRLP
jgi:hypothetical protein